jgi:hypothetical protein
MKTLGLLTLAGLAVLVTGAPVQAQRGTVTDGEKAAIVTALNDEYVAGTTYQAVLSKFGAETQPFAKIYLAELQHQAVLINLLKKYNVDVPANPYDVDTIKATLPDTVGECCAIGVAIETENIALYDELLKVVTRPDVKKVLQSLQTASRDRHLPAFENCVACYGDGPRDRNRWQNEE